MNTEINLAKNYAPGEFEDRIYKNWCDKGYFTPDRVQMIEAYRQSMIIGGLDLSVQPEWKDITVIIPIISFVSSLGSSIVSM